MKKTLLVLAAGMGSRYGGLKQLDGVGPSGETIMDYSVFDAIRAGFEKVVFIIRRDFHEDFKAAIGSKYEGKIEVDYAFQELTDLPEGFEVPEDRTKPWGTGHAFLAARNAVKEPSLAINADDFYGSESYKLAADYLDSFTPGKVEAGMIGFKLNRTLSDFGSVSRGLCHVDAEGNLTGVQEITKIEKGENGIETNADVELTGEESVSMNMWVFSPEVFPAAEKLFVEFLKKDIETPKSEFYIPSIANEAIENYGAQAKVITTSADWFGVTYQEDRPDVVARLQKMADAGEYPQQLWS